MCLKLFNYCTSFGVGQESVVGVTTRHSLDSSGMESWWGARFAAHAQTSPGDHPASYSMGTRSFKREKQPVRGLDHPLHLMPRSKKV